MKPRMRAMPTHHDLANVIRQIAALLRGPHRPSQYETDIAADSEHRGRRQP
jgi:hypothetical protein